MTAAVQNTFRALADPSRRMMLMHLCERDMTIAEVADQFAMTRAAVDQFGKGGVVAAASPVEMLSDRELEVFQLIGQGYGTRKIAEMLHLSIKTIETYRAHIKFKLDLDNAAHLLQYAVQWVGSQS